MTCFTDVAENRLIDWLFRGQAAPALPASWYFGLLNSPTNDAASPLAEVTGNGYARVAVARTLAAFAGTQGVGTTAASTGASATTSNNADVVFAAPTGDWGSISSLGIFDAAVGGNLWFYAPLAAAKTVNNGDAPPKFPTAAFTFTLDN
ncbi:MAG: hypothetical protein JO290_01160 [Sphingomonadaceae bacterium]|nr:hypothetical protein [Sphingomonadaceae bacterium]